MALLSPVGLFQFRAGTPTPAPTPTPTQDRPTHCGASSTNTRWELWQLPVSLNSEEQEKICTGTNIKPFLCVFWSHYPRLGARGHPSLSVCRPAHACFSLRLFIRVFRTFQWQLLSPAAKPKCETISKPNKSSLLSGGQGRQLCLPLKCGYLKCMGVNTY